MYMSQEYFDRNRKTEVGSWKSEVIRFAVIRFAVIGASRVIRFGVIRFAVIHR